MKTKASKRGGARRGAGRPALDTVSTPSVKLEEPEADHLAEIREREELASDGDALRWLIRRDRQLAERRARRA